jgi:hypothetical protein
MLRMWTVISLIAIFSFLFWWRVRYKSGGNIKDKAAPLEAPARETKSPTSGTKVDTSDEKHTRRIRTDDLGIRLTGSKKELVEPEE